jgi:serine/threonine-protein kinase
VLLDLAMDTIVHSRKDVMVPDFKGKSLSDAIALTSSMNLGIKKDGDEYAQNLPAGTIIRQNPLPGMTVKEGKLVKVTLSRGGEVLFVPALAGQPVRTAEIAIRQAGMALGEESTRFSLKIDKGNVITQDPLPGAIADKDSIVNIVVSAGRPPEGTLLMPDFTGRPVDEAKSWSSANKISLQIAEEKSTTAAPGCVLRQTPLPDQEVAVGSSVSVIVASGQSSGSATSIGRNFYYEIPQGGDMRVVRITMLDDSGEKEIFKGERAPGSKIELPINARGSARARIYLNGILVEETDIK